MGENSHDYFNEYGSRNFASNKFSIADGRKMLSHISEYNSEENDDLDKLKHLFEKNNNKNTKNKTKSKTKTVPRTKKTFQSSIDVSMTA